MAEELAFYTGTLQYREIDFTFAFDKDELRLIPPKDKEHEIEWEWRRKPLGNGAFTLGNPVPVGVDFLIGECNETRRHIVFLPKQGAFLSIYNSVVRIPLAAYAICKYDRDSIDRVSFSCPEINHIHPVNQAITLTLPEEEFQDKGIVSVSTQEFDRTTTEMQTFTVENKEIKVYFGVSRSVSTNIHESPLQLKSALMFEFEAINDYRFIYRLWWIAREFVRFLCYRKNVFIPKVELAAPYEGGKHEAFATMYLIGQDGETETDTLKKGRIIKQVRITGHEGNILSDIADDNLYLRHLPETYQSGRHIDAARFVMITAAFEWEFRRLYPEGVEKTVETIEAEKVVSDRIQEHIDETSGKQKKIYKFLKKLVRSDSLQSEIVQMGNDFSGIIGPFGDRLYRFNEQELKYTEMGQRLADQRNHFAHGDLDKEFIGLSLLDLIYLEYVVYAMQLKFYGVQDIEIQKSINDLFHLNVAL
ncbi:MAG: hypothetical protein K5868_09485 [Lachnospiraceae bacterium]|nr:hypothetical protein [Lachnospiraceae bacterium]